MSGNARTAFGAFLVAALLTASCTGEIPALRPEPPASGVAAHAAPLAEAPPHVTPRFAAPAESAEAETGEAEPAEEAIEDVEAEKVEPSDEWHSEAYPRIDRAVNLHFARSTRRGVVKVVIDHRNFQSVSEDPGEDLFGFDGGNLKIGLGLRYGVFDHVDVGLYRLNGTVEPFDVYEFDSFWQLLRQENGDPIDLVFRPGITWFQQDGGDATGALLQLLVTRLFAPRLTVGTGILFHSESTNDVKREDDDDHSVALPLVAEFRALKWLSLDFEMSAGIAGYRAAHPIFAVAPKIITHGHTFAIALSNTQYMSADGLVANTWRGFDDLILGFSITREIGTR